MNITEKLGIWQIQNLLKGNTIGIEKLKTKFNKQKPQLINKESHDDFIEFLIF